MNKKPITAYNFKRYMTSQPFFVWHTLNGIKDFDIDFWTSKEKEEVTDDSSGVVAKTFFYIDKYLREKLKSNGDIVILSGNSEQKIKQTLELLDSGKIIINPVFEYNGAIAKPFAFDTIKKHIIELKYSRKTKRIDIVNGYFNYSVISNVTEVIDYMLYLPSDDDCIKGEIALVVTDSVHTNIDSDIPGTTNSNKKIKQQKFMNFFKTRKFLCNKNSSLDKIILLPEFDSALLQIEKDRDVITYSESEIWMDNTPFGFNSEWDELMKKIRPEIAGINGNVVSKKKIIEGIVPKDDSPVFEMLNKIDSAIILNEDIEEYKKINEVEKVVWYDFEGYSLPIAPLDGIKPYQQLVFQVSVINTIKNKITKSINHVCDPKYLDLDKLYKIIEIVYQGGADAYVVYNKGYELSRMKEIVNLLQQAEHPSYEKATKMLEEIKEKTVDLMNVFKITSTNKLPNIMLHDQKAKSSIKNIEKHITQNNIPIKRPITPYKNLDIQNGGMAMNEAILRALDITGDKKWIEIVAQLKLYCENDVKAMIMVYDFITYLKTK